MSFYPSHFFRGMIILIVVTLSFYGFYSIIVSISSNDKTADYISIADTAFVAKVSDTFSKEHSMNVQRQFKPLHIELNGADTSALKRVYGIGSVYATGIIVYRNLLGGYFSVDQLKEVKGIDNEKFDQIKQNFYVDSTRIIKININFASTLSLIAHPYVSKSMARRIEKYKQLKDKQSKGGIFNLQELLAHDILLPYEAHKIAPYVIF